MIASLLFSMADEVAVVAEPPPRWFLAAIVAAVVLMALFILRMAVVSSRRRAQKRTCPTCGGGVQAGWRLCPACGNALASAAPAMGGAPVAAPAAAPTGRAAIEFRTGPLAGRTYFLDADVTTIGSFEGNTVLLNDTGVSRKHAGIRRVDGGYELADLGSTNGIYVNGETSARRKLVAGDIIRIGTSEASFKA